MESGLDTAVRGQARETERKRGKRQTKGKGKKRDREGKVVA